MRSAPTVVMASPRRTTAAAAAARALLLLSASGHNSREAAPQNTRDSHEQHQARAITSDVVRATRLGSGLVLAATRRAHLVHILLPGGVWGV